MPRSSLDSFEPTRRLKTPNAKCSLKWHFYGCCREVAGRVDFLAGLRKDRFVFERVSEMAKKCKPYGKKKYSLSMVEKSLKFLREHFVISERQVQFVNGRQREGFYVIDHADMFVRKGKLCSNMWFGDPEEFVRKMREASQNGPWPVTGPITGSTTVPITGSVTGTITVSEAIKRLKNYGVHYGATPVNMLENSCDTGTLAENGIEIGKPPAAPIRKVGIALGTEGAFGNRIGVPSDGLNLKEEPQTQKPGKPNPSLSSFGTDRQSQKPTQTIANYFEGANDDETMLRLADGAYEQLRAGFDNDRQWRAAVLYAADAVREWDGKPIADRKTLGDLMGRVVDKFQAKKTKVPKVWVKVMYDLRKGGPFQLKPPEPPAPAPHIGEELWTAAFHAGFENGLPDTAKIIEYQNQHGEVTPNMGAEKIAEWFEGLIQRVGNREAFEKVRDKMLTL
jgi:hypothetical protein